MTHSLSVSPSRHATQSAPSTSKTAAGSAAAFYAQLSRDALMQQALSSAGSSTTGAVAGAGAHTDTEVLAAAAGAAVGAAQADSPSVEPASERGAAQLGAAECPGAAAINKFLMAGRRQLVEGGAGTGTVTAVVAADHAGRWHLIDGPQQAHEWMDE